jgi:DNA repair ATPase RecN
MDAVEIAQEMSGLNAEYDELHAETEALYVELSAATGDPGHFRDVSRAISAKQTRMERIEDRLAQLKRLREQF